MKRFIVCIALVSFACVGLAADKPQNTTKPFAIGIISLFHAIFSKGKS